MAKRPESLKRAQAAYEDRTVKLNVRLSPEEKARLDEKARLLKIKPTTLIKRWIAEAAAAQPLPLPASPDTDTR